MNRHERCNAAIAGRSVDRLPAYLPAISCSVASAILGRPAHGGTGSLHYAEVLAWSRGEQAHAEFEEALYRDMLDLHRALDLDVLRMPWRMNARPTRQVDPYTFLFGDEQGDHSVWQYQPGSGDFSTIKVVDRGLDNYEDRLRDAVKRDEVAIAGFGDTARAWVNAHLSFWERMGREFFVPMAGGGIGVGDSEHQLMALAQEPELVGRSLMIQARRAAAIGEALVRSPAPPVMLGGGDMAGQQGPIYSPQAFRQVMLPAYRWALERLNPLGVHYVFRSDGNLWSVSDMLFGEARCPGYGETDRDAGMTLAQLRQRFGKMVVWGNFSCAFLQRATPQQVRDEARRLRDESGGTAYFQGTSNAVMLGTPVANVEALYSVR